MSNIVIKSAVTETGRLESGGEHIRQYMNDNKGEMLVISMFNARSIPGTLDLLKFDDIGQTLETVEKLINTNVDHTKPQACSEVMSELGEWLGYMAKVQASAKFYALTAKQSAVEEMPDDIRQMSTMIQREWINGRCAAMEAMYELAERMFKAATARCDHLRTFISFEKEQIRLVPSGTGTTNNQSNKYFPRTTP
jgi:hypothetical protein